MSQQPKLEARHATRHIGEHIDLSIGTLPSGADSKLQDPALQIDAEPVAVLEQYRMIRRSQKVELYNNGVIAVITSGRRQEPALIRVEMLQSEPRTIYSISYRLFGLFALMLGVTLTLQAFHWPLSYTLVLSVATLLTAIAALLRSSYRLTYKTLCGDITVLELRSSLLNRDKANQFASQIRQLAARHSLALQPGIPVLVQEHRRLANVGLVSMAQYEIAKKRIFSSAK